MTRQLAKVGAALTFLICSMKDFGSSGLNRPERSRSARTTRAMFAPEAASPPKSGMAMGSGCTLPWFTSTCSAANAWPANPIRSANAKATVFIGLSKLLSHHLPRIEVERVDLAPLAVAVRRQLIRRACIDRASRRVRRRAHVRIARGSGGRVANQLWRLCDGTVLFQEQIEVDDELARVGRAYRRAARIAGQAHAAGA